MAETEPVAQATLAEVISAVKRELAAAEGEAGPRAGLVLDEVEIELSVTRSRTAGGKLSVGVPVLGVELGGGGALTDKHASKVKVVLAPPAPSLLLRDGGIGDLGIAAAIVDIRSQLVAGLEEEPRLVPKKAEYHLEFAVERAGGPTGKVTFLVVSVGGEGKWTGAATNRIKLSFAGDAAP